MNAKEIMTKDVVTVSAATGLREIYEIFRRTRYGGLPVTDKDKKALGIITKSEILSIFLPDYFDLLGENIMFIDNFGVLDEEFESLPCFELFVAADIMQKKVVMVTEDVSILKVAAVMRKHKVRRVMVGRDNIISGIITRGDICRSFFEKETCFKW